MAVEQMGAYSEPVRHLHLVGLDAWQFSVDATPGGRTHTADCHASATLAARSVEAHRYEEFMQALQDRIAEGGKKRRRETPKTPDIIAAALEDAHARLRDEARGPQEARGLQVARGGFAEAVGRGAEWALVKAVFRELLGYAPAAGSEALADRVAAYVDLWLLEGQLDCSLAAFACGLSRDRSGAVLLEAAMQMLRAAAEKVGGADHRRVPDAAV